MATRRPAARSLADELRAWDDARLVALLRARPDLLAPTPTSLSSLASRSTSRASVQRALDQLDAFPLQVLDALAVLPDASKRADVARLLGLDATAVAATLDRLRGLALIWGSDTALRLVSTVRDIVGPHPAGLGPKSPSGPVHDPSSLAKLLADAPDGARDVLDRLAWGPPVGAVAGADRPVGPQPRTPVEWLLAQRLLAVADPGHVVLPREVGLALRGGRVHREVLLEPPEVTGQTRTPGIADSTAGAAASELLRHVSELGEIWGAMPPPLLRSRGLGVRDLKRTAAALDLVEPQAALVIEVAFAAGLVADDGQAGASWAPTPHYDVWTSAPPPSRWRQLASAWLAMTRTPGLAGSRDERGTVRAALSVDLERPAAAVVRATVVRELAALPTGCAPDVDSLLERLRWRAPRRSGGLHDQLARWVLEEAELIGVTGRGALSGAGQALLTGDRGGIEQAVEQILPPLLDHVLLQADLTAVAPGPLEPELGHLMRLAADVESRGGATVYRFTAGSVRRALDSGWSADQLLAQIAAASRTPVPQPLDYLVRDVARRHGQVRVGTASSYVRSDDEAVLREILADRRAGSLQLRPLAPTVLAARAEPATVLAVLRDIGLAPVAESTSGDVVVRRPDARRTPPRQRPVPRAGPGVPADALLDAVVRSLRLASESASARDGDGFGTATLAPRLVPSEPAVTLARLREAAAARARVWIGYADGNGRIERLVVAPLSVDGGRVTAFDPANDEVRTFSAHRVIGVSALDQTALDQTAGGLTDPGSTRPATR